MTDAHPTPAAVHPAYLAERERHNRSRARLTTAVGRWGPEVARRYASLCTRARVVQRATAAGWRRSRTPRRRPTTTAISYVLAFLRAALVVAVAVLTLTAVKAMAEDAPRADVPCPAPVVLEAGAEDADEAAAWAAAKDAAWWRRHAAMMAALASLPDNGPTELTDEIVDAFIGAVIAASYATPDRLEPPAPAPIILADKRKRFHVHLPKPGGPRWPGPGPPPKPRPRK